ncbi:hypothetical protein SARC_00171 [Sphaeroforma arctica JP610]|uniref:Cytochrome b561 domain-containing protein n=1 Tax=Sphaeroforma arctica JP610 TaxID=667725 RepID=A0A0L0GFD5_9EUKA|nr:hypothetical protein SARC_00171 [Sphaeroforma arctica JP610]KNC87737.1 hypothetical protein SARC_00171 [Sphaeroforma arctica JP610]|eukprot:XP_014161639.1 hypothetical protein SARC_00171 [Sphaeroforma arctica JP610]
MAVSKLCPIFSVLISLLMLTSTVAAQTNSSEYCVSSNSSYARQLTLAPGLTVAFNLNGPSIDVLATIDQTVGWLGVGFAEVPGSMIPAKVIIGTAEPNTVQAYETTSRNGAGVNPATFDTVTYGAFTQVEDKAETTLSFTVSQRTVPGLESGAETYMVFAYGAGEFGYHGTNRGSVTVNLVTCEGTLTENTTYRKALLAHGILMALAWLLLTPIAIFSSAFRPIFTHFKDDTGLWWFHSHVTMNILGLMASTVGFGVSFLLVSQINFTDKHHILGLCVMIIGWIQPFNALLRPRRVTTYKQHNDAPKSVWEFYHKGVGYIGMVLAMINCKLGLDLAFASTGLFIAYGVCVGLWLVAYVTLYIKYTFYYQPFDMSVRYNEKPRTDDARSENFNQSRSGDLHENSSKSRNTASI